MNRFPLRSLTLFLALLMVTSMPAEVDAQRGSATYEDLRQRSDQPNIYTNYLNLPATGNNAVFLASFRMDYDLLPFRRVRSGQNAPDNTEFFSTASMNMEVFRGSLRDARRGSFEPVARNSWSDTAYAASFEETKSRFTHLEGATFTKLEPGEYSVVLDLNRDGSQRHARSREITFTVPEFSDHEKGKLFLLESIRQEDDSYTVKFLNYGEFALYGQDYKLMALLPSQADAESYQLKMERLRSGSDSQSNGEILFEKEIRQDEILHTPGFEYPEGNKKPVLKFNTADEGHQIAVLDIPASKFPNVRYKITLTAEDGDEPLAEQEVSSRWIDMPVSLLNLNVAIDMLRFIVDEEQLNRMRRGTAEERERKFREFWAERDPNPDTEFNELMAEYYKRIDYAFDNFTTPERPGYQSDQGQAFILYGEPRNKERTFPTSGPTREVWEYRDRVLVFEATSGFGDFRLVEQRRP